MTQVWKSDAYDGGTLLVLLALADWAADDGTSIFPKVATVGKKARLCPRQVQNCFAQLRADGVLVEVAKAKRGRGTEYRLIIDRVKELRRKDCVAISSGETGFRKGVKPIAVVGTNPISPPIVEPPVDPSENRHSGASEAIASLPKGSSERWPEMRKAFADTWPDGFPASDEARAKAEFERITRLHPAATVIGCAEAHGAELARRKAKRGGMAGPFLFTQPAKWLKDGGWEGYVSQVQEAAADEVDRALSLAHAHSNLGPGIIEILRKIGMTEDDLALQSETTFEEGPPPCFIVTRSFPGKRLRDYASKLQAELKTDDLQIIIAGARRSA